MKPLKLTQRKWNYKAFAFFIPFIGILLSMLIKGCVPFGNKSMLYSDMYHQYYPFFLSFRRALLSGDSPLHNWDVGMGMDYIGLYSYYLASPLNLLTVLLPESFMLPYFSLLVPIKLGLSGLFFAIFLNRIFQKDDLSISLFGSFYALSAWALAYQWNIMWLDTFALLPLVVLGTVSLLKDKKFFLYTLTLFLSIWSNYYIGLFTCIFVALVFFCYQICRWEGFCKFFCDLGRIALFSLLAIGMTAILELPTLSALQSTQSSVNKFPESFRLNIASEHTWKGLLDAMRQVAGNMNGGITPSFKEGLPNLYCGILTNILAFLFLTSKHVKFRDKLCSVLLLLFFNVSFIIRQLDYIWHGFHFTNMIPYRFSFLYSFVLLYMAYRSYLLRKTFKLWQIIVAGVVAIGIGACSQLLYKDSSTTELLVFALYNGVFLLLYIGTLVYRFLPVKFSAETAPDQIRELNRARKTRRKYSGFILAGLMFAELMLTVICWTVWFPTTSVANYPKGTDKTASVVRYMKQREAGNLFYRTETTHSQTLNDGALNNYRGISTFTSSANVSVTEFMKALGYGAKNTYNRYCFEESSPVANLFLGIKYMLERDNKVEENPYFDDVYTYGDTHLLENNAYLPLGFLTDSQLLNVEFADAGNRFVFQNELLQAATGIREDVWELMQGSCLTITPTDATLSTSSTASGYSSYTTSSAAGSVVYSYTAYKEGFMCINLDLSKKNSYTVSKNGNELYAETYSLPQMIAVCQVTPGDVIDVTLKCKADETGNITVTAGLLRDSVFRNAYDILSTSTLQLTSFRNTRIEGIISCDRDGVLYTSIPQNGNWFATVDGKETEVVAIGDAMVGLLLSEGDHEIVFSYRNNAFRLGWKISLLCLLLFLAICYPYYRPYLMKRKGKYQK